MGFTKKDVEELSAALSEPGWVLDRRMEAWGSFESLELPHEKEEPWRYTDFRRLKFQLDEFAPTRPKSATDITKQAEALVEQEGDRAGYIIQRDADIVHVELDPGAAEQGVILTDLNTAIREHGDLVKEHLFQELDPGRHIFTALHGALFSGGSFLYVPKGVTIAAPIESQRWIDEPGAIFPHTLVIVEEDAEVTYFERFRSTNSAPALSNGGFELTAGRASRVNVVTLQEYSDPVWQFQTHRASLGADVSFKSLVVNLGGRFARHEVEAAIRGERSSIDMLGLYFAERDQHFDFRTLQDHIAGSSRSDLLYKGAVKDRSRAVYSGLIRVGKKAAFTDAYQTNRNLVLSDQAKADSKPELEIENNEVRCSHAASVSQMEENELFYLQSRGIPRLQAERLIVNGFFEDVVSRITLGEVRMVLLEAIERKLAA